MHSALQAAVVTIISYKITVWFEFARYTEQYGSYMPSSPLGSISSSLMKLTQNFYVCQRKRVQ